MKNDATMPDGRPFRFWDDATEYRKVYHVACDDPSAADDNPGTADRPLRTISRAAELLMPGEKAVIHGGVYREFVRPARGGTGPDRMIAYEAAPGERVTIKGSRVWTGPFEESCLAPGRDDAPPGVYMGVLPREFFPGFNPFLARNMRGRFLTMPREWVEPRQNVILGTQGMVFVDGVPLPEVTDSHRLLKGQTGFWVERSGLRMHFRLPGNVAPAGHTIEVTTQEQVFAPEEAGLGYIRVSGLGIEHAGDMISPPQRAMLSANRGHHWIVEDCRLRHAHALGMDVGMGFGPKRKSDKSVGGHIIRRNHVSDCGQCGIAGERNVDGTLVEDNVVEHIGDLDLEWYEESAALKFHVADRVLVRRNVFRHVRHAAGVWMDYLCTHCRVTDNVFADVLTMMGAVYFEGPPAPNAVDRNLFWRIRNGDHRDPQPPWVEHGGLAVDCDSGESLLVAHNLVVEGQGRYAISLHLQQNSRSFGGWKGMCDHHVVRNNVLIGCRRCVHFGQASDNTSDGNVFAGPLSGQPFTIRNPEPAAHFDWRGWRDSAGQDSHSVSLDLEAAFDPDALELTLRASAAPPTPLPIPGFPEDGAVGVGPLTGAEWQSAREGGVTLTFPRGQRGCRLSDTGRATAPVRGGGRDQPAQDGRMCHG